MSAPTPAEVAEALAVLRRVPGVRDIDSLGVIERANSPMRRFATELRVWLGEDLPDTAAEMERELTERAARHGLRITSDTSPDPSALIGYQLLQAVPGNRLLPWRHHDAHHWYMPSAIESLRRDIRDNLYPAAVYGLPRDLKADG